MFFTASVFITSVFIILFCITYVVYYNLLNYLLTNNKTAQPAPCRFVILKIVYPSIGIYLLSSMTGFASFFGTDTFKMPSSNLALISSCKTSSPT